MAEIDVEIDDFANSVIHEPSGEVFPTRIVPWSELQPQQKGVLARWKFDWSREANTLPREVFALLVEGSDAIQGFLSLVPERDFLFIFLVESAPQNIGQQKEFRGVAGNLFAFACARSMRLGFEGFVAFDAKTELIEHYTHSLGAQQVGSSLRMIIASESADSLMERYQKEADRWPL